MENTLTKLQTDKYFAVQFAVDNNPAGFISVLSSMGYSGLFTGNIEQDKLTAKKLIFDFIGNKDVESINKVFNSVNYLDNDVSSAEYTKGFRDFFITSTPQTLVGNPETYANKSGFSFDGLMAGLGAGLITYTQVVSSGGQSAGKNETPEQIKAREEEEKKKRRRTTWIIAGSILAIAGIITTIVVFTKKDKK